LLEQARSDGIGELTVPRRIVVVRSVPLLGTGKTDYAAARQLAVTAQENAGANAT
jgi:acyl-[acyl-carrier-protein]-phospholipid O-acyltransferase/long-chain-fatty-acid--[acyl-carrier-protein] ligase